MKARMGYKFTGSGHEVPEEKRKYDHNVGLTGAFIRCLSNFEKGELKAEPYIKDLETSIEEMHSILPAFQDHENFFDAAGQFLSAVYNKVPDTQIVFDVKLDIRLAAVGRKLAKNKTLINRAAVHGVGDWAVGTIINEGSAEYAGFGATGDVINLGNAEQLGINASGKVINYGDAQIMGIKDELDANLRNTAQLINYGHVEELGNSVRFLVINLGTTGERTSAIALPGSITINYGKTGRNFGSQSEGILLAYENPASFGQKSRAKIAWSKEDCKEAPRLWKYLTNLKEKLETGRTDYKKALAVLEEMNVHKDISKIIRKEGYEI